MGLRQLTTRRPTGRNVLNFVFYLLRELLKNPFPFAYDSTMSLYNIMSELARSH